MSCLGGPVIFLVRSADNLTAKRILFGFAIGFATISLIIVKTWLNEAAVLPLPALELYDFTSGFALYAALKKN